jgi:hypothetical protein
VRESLGISKIGYKCLQQACGAGESEGQGICHVVLERAQKVEERRYGAAMANELRQALGLCECRLTKIERLNDGYERLRKKAMKKVPVNH